MFVSYLSFRTAATFKMERFVMIVNGWKLLTIITKSSILDVAAVLDTPLLLHKTEKVLLVLSYQDSKSLFHNIINQNNTLDLA